MATRDQLLKIKHLPLWILIKIAGEGGSDCSLAMPPAVKLVDGKCAVSTNGINDLAKIRLE